MDRFDAMQMFVRAIEKGSFSAVAKERGIGQPAVSKQISALEDELGTELIHRTSRSITLTEAGRDFYDSALHILDDFENATSRIGRGQTAPKGFIRVTVPPTFARLHMVSKLPAFFAAYPDMAVEMAASESPTTIVEDGFDLAIHSGDLPDSTLVARRFAQTMIILVATPQYLTRYGAPESPEELDRFRSVVYVERGSVQPWSFGSGQDAKRVIPTGVFRTSDIEQMRMGVLEHLGIAQAPAWLFAAELREGAVIRLLTAFERTVPILAVRPASRRLSTKVRIFIEHLEKTFAVCPQFNPRGAPNGETTRQKKERLTLQLESRRGQAIEASPQQAVNEYYDRHDQRRSQQHVEPPRIAGAADGARETRYRNNPSLEIKIFRRTPLLNGHKRV
jgi:DNA-binding transcriptional LysR family regulator